MLYVKTEIRPSPIHGVGLFAAQAIPKGALIWKFDSGFDILVSKEKYSSLSEIGKDFLDHYGYWSKEMDAYICTGDNHRFTNHSENPYVGTVNAGPGDDGQDVALRDIEPGEEITVDYRVFGENPEEDAPKS